MITDVRGRVLSRLVQGLCAVILLALSVNPLIAQGTLALSSGGAAPNGSATLNLTLASPAGSEPAGIQWTLTYSPTNIVSISAIAGASGAAAGKSLSCSASSGSYICLLVGLNSNVMQNGVAAVVNVTMASGVPSTTINVTNTLGATAAATSLLINGFGGIVTAAAPPLTTLNAMSCVPASLSTGGSSTCTAPLNAPAPAGGVVVYLSNNAAALTVPASVTVGAGSTTATFTASAGTITSDQTASITAMLNGSTQTATISLATAAGIMKQYTSRTTFAADDAVDWGALTNLADGDKGVTIKGSFTGLTSGLGTVVISGSVPGSNLKRFNEGISFFGNFTGGDRLLATLPGDSGPLTITFTSGPVYGAGLQIESVNLGPFTGQMKAFDSAGNLLGTITVSGTATSELPANNSAPFMGLRSSLKEIARLEIDTPGILGFAVNRLDVAGKPMASAPGVFRSGFLWLLDADGNHQFNAPPDKTFAFGGIPGDIPITGDWSGSGSTKVGVYRSSNGLFILDYDGDGLLTAADKVFALGVGTQPGDIPVVGDWNGSGTSKVGIFRQGFFWILDTNGNGVFEQGIDAAFAFGGTPGDIPVVGDWNGSGTSKVGVFRAGFLWILDTNGNGAIDAADQVFPFGGIAGDVPIVGDWNGDGRTKVGVFRMGFFWVLDTNGNQVFDGGIDQAFAFGGIAGDKPVVGKW